MNSKFCSQCGNALALDAHFCGRCGAVVSGDQQTYVLVRPKIPGRGLGISSMVLGIIGLVYSVPAVIVAGQGDMSMAALCILSILALIFGGVSLGRNYRTGISISGVIMGIAGLISYIVSVIMFLSV